MMNLKFIIPWDLIAKFTNLRLISLCLLIIHYLGAFYYMLENLRPSLRSNINTIQLLVLANYTSVAEFGIDVILKPAIEDIKNWYFYANCVLVYFFFKENGVTFVLNDGPCHLYGTVTIVSGDNPASAALGGFKQSASAFRYCRHCLGTEIDIQSKV